MYIASYIFKIDYNNLCMYVLVKLLHVLCRVKKKEFMLEI